MTTSTPIIPKNLRYDTMRIIEESQKALVDILIIYMRYKVVENGKN